MSKTTNPTFKVVCLIDKGKGNGTEEYPLFITSEDEQEAEKDAKYYWIVGKGSEHGWSYFGVKKVTKV